MSSSPRAARYAKLRSASEARLPAAGLRRAHGPPSISPDRVCARWCRAWSEACSRGKVGSNQAPSVLSERPERNDLEYGGRIPRRIHLGATKSWPDFLLPEPPGRASPPQPTSPASRPPAIADRRLAPGTPPIRGSDIHIRMISYLRLILRLRNQISRVGFVILLSDS